MAKTPHPGRSKTRLCPPLAHDDAARMSAAFLADMVAAIAAAGRDAPIDAVVAYAPAGTEAGLTGHLPVGTALLLADGADVDAPGVTGFGRALLQTVRSLLAAGYAAACVLNSDSPTLPPAHLVAAARHLLAGGDTASVLGPADDGGYYLLGLRRPLTAAFADIAWSTGDVGNQTAHALSAAGCDTLMLPPWYDVDDADGLRRLLAELADPAQVGVQPPATIAAIAGLGIAARLQPAA